MLYFPQFASCFQSHDHIYLNLKLWRNKRLTEPWATDFVQLSSYVDPVWIRGAATYFAVQCVAFSCVKRVNLKMCVRACVVIFEFARIVCIDFKWVQASRRRQCKTGRRGVTTSPKQKLSTGWNTSIHFNTNI